MSVLVTVHIYDNNLDRCVVKDVTLPLYPNCNDSLLLEDFGTKLKISNRIVGEYGVAVYCDITKKGLITTRADLFDRLRGDYGWVTHKKVEVADENR